MGILKGGCMDNNAKSLIKFTSKIYRCTQWYLDRKLEKFHLSAGTYPYLLTLNNNEGICQNQISRELNVDKAMSARTIKKLIEIGYIRKEEDKEDVRAYKLYITEEGKSVVPKIHKIIDEWIEILIEDSSNEEINTSINFLKKVLNNGKKHKEKCCEGMKKN
jgi:DNA-binding MarR family transcriptional regulator